MNAGHHDAAWRHPRTQPERITDLSYFQELARTAERGKLDSLFLADGVALWGNARYNAVGGFEPLTLLSALAVATEHIGLIATVSTTFNEPFHVARKFASLDHLSGGRAAGTSSPRAMSPRPGTSAARSIWSTRCATSVPPSSWM